MKLAVAFSVFVAVVLAAPKEAGEGLVLAEPCDESVCLPPDCRCTSTSIPGGLAPRDVPQFVVVTFDDAVNTDNIANYREILYGRQNPNGCRAGTTFFVSHEYTDYPLVNELYNEGFEIALHSISHRVPQSFWITASYEDMKKEFGDQMLQMSHFANIPNDEIKGLRMPFIQMAGNVSFQFIADYGLDYDSSWSTNDQIVPVMWPYTLDYASTQECIILPCPTASIPGVWVFPINSWFDLEGDACAFVDSCYHVPDQIDEEAWFRFMVGNFERHYLSNRVPFPLYLHEWFIAETTNPAVRRAFIRFLDMINNLSDVYMVNSQEVIDWVKNPIPVDEYKQKECRSFTPTSCPASNCAAMTSDHNGWTYWLRVCNVCPTTYPWVGNPLGQ